MRRDRRIRTLSTLLTAAAFAAGCAALSYDEPGLLRSNGEPVQATAAAPAPAEASAADWADVEGGTETDTAPASAPARKSTPTRARLAELDPEEVEAPRDWRALSRLAREKAQNGELDAANELLAQAALQLKDRRPTYTPRRTVFGLRARLAHDLAALGEPEKADALADQLFEEARLEPALGDAALVTLARATAERRATAARAAGRSESQLPLLALAFDASQTGTASRERLNLAFEVSGKALRAGDFELARRAIDQAILDARILAPADRMQAAALKIYKARVALAARDLGVAEASAQAAVRLFESESADGSNLGVAEATLGQVLAEKGELERALALGRGAYARLGSAETIVPHARRQIPACLARIEWLAGERDAAGAHYREALAVPADGSERDLDLIADIKTALAELESAPSAAPAP